jgi:chromosome segregation ATPase
LGCYHSNQEGIFVYNVSDPRLAGVEQVTAAHEMLHAAYDRLRAKDRNNVDTLLENYFKTVTDQRIIDTMNSYKQSEPNDVVNEMHSVFGTEISNLPAPLESYYTRYFSDRQAITAFAAAYQGEFTSREDQIKADDAQLAQLKDRINSEEASLNAQLSQINSDRARLDSLRASGQIDQYNAGVAPFNEEVDSYNSGVKRLRDDIADYNQLVNTRNAIASELASLDQSIDTRLAPQPTK